VPTGGVVGQVLGKMSATNYDTAWVEQTGGGTGGGAPTTAPYVTTAPDAGLFNEKVLAVGTGLTLTEATVTVNPAAMTAQLNVFTPTVNGIVPNPTAVDTTKFLRTDGTWQTPAGGGGAPTGAPYVLFGATDATLTNERRLTAGSPVILLTDSGAGSTLAIDVSPLGIEATHLNQNAVTNAKLADMASPRIKGRVTGGAGDPEDLTAAQVTALLDPFTATLKGLVPPPTTVDTTKYLRTDGTWQVPASGAGGGVTDAHYVLTAPHASLPDAHVLTMGPGLIVEAAADQVTMTIAAGAVTDAMLRTAAGCSVIGRGPATAGAVGDLVATADGQVLRRAGGVVAFGDPPGAGAGGAPADATYLVAGTNAVLSNERVLTGSAAVSVTHTSGVTTLDVPAGAIDNARLGTMTLDTIKGRIGTSGAPQDLTPPEATAILSLFTSGLRGLVPPSGGNAANFLRADGVWAAGGGGAGGGIDPGILDAPGDMIVATAADTPGRLAIGTEGQVLTVTAPALTRAVTPVAVDAVSTSAAVDGGMSVTWAHTCAGANRALMVTIQTTSGYGTVSGVTYAGAALTPMIQSYAFGGVRTDVWTRLAPATGANNIVVTFSGAAYARAGAISATGVDQTTSYLVSPVTATGTSAAPTATATMPQGALAFQTVHCPGGAAVFTGFGAGQTQTWNHSDTSQNARGAASYKAVAAAGAVTMSATMNQSAAWATYLTAFLPVPAGAALQVAWQTPTGGGGGGGAPVDAPYVTTALHGTLTSESVLTVQSGLTLSGATIGVNWPVFTGLLDLFSATTRGVVPPSGGGIANFLRADGIWTAPSGGGGASFNVIDAAGDLIVGAADNTEARLAMGALGQVLTVVEHVAMATRAIADLASSTGGPIDNATTSTWSHTCAGTNRALIVSVVSQPGAGLVTGVTYAGVAMTALCETQYNTNTTAKHDLYGLVNPATGANNVVVTFNTNATGRGGALSCSGVDQTTPFLTPAINWVTSTTVSQSATLPAGAVAVQQTCIDGGYAFTSVGTGETQAWTGGNTAGPVVRGLLSYKAVVTAGSVTMSDTLNNAAPANTIVTAFLPFGGGTGATTKVAWADAAAGGGGIPPTLLDVKGDLIVASAADTAARLAVGGTNGHVLTVDSAATYGIQWAALPAAAASPVRAGAYVSGFSGALSNNFGFASMTRTGVGAYVALGPFTGVPRRSASRKF
jgi:hypothetical protein